MASLSRALETEAYNRAAAVQAQAAASAMALRCLDDLRTQAARDPMLGSADRVAVWMGGFQHLLGGGGGRPKDFCVDRLTLGQCLARLPSRLAKNGRARGR